MRKEASELLADLQTLSKMIDDSGYKLGYLADQLGISRQALWKKLHGQNSFTLKEASDLAALLKMTSKQKLHIFLP